jgi:AcrR family transcriptional regulator
LSEVQRARRWDAVHNETAVRRAANELFAELGMAMTSAAIAERAGVGRATVYRTFPTRDALIGAVYEDRVEWLRVRLEEALGRDDAWRAHVELLHEVMQRLRVDRGLGYALAPGSDLDERVLEPVRALFDRLLAAVKSTGRIRSDVTTDDMANLASGMADSLRRRQEFAAASWTRAADLVMAACGTYPPAVGVTLDEPGPA